jgi:hypothetical protein
MTGILAMSSRRNLMPAWWALDGFSVVLTDVLYPSHRPTRQMEQSWCAIRGKTDILQIKPFN